MARPKKSTTKATHPLNRLKELREENKWSQAEAAQKLELETQTYQRYESSQRKIPQEVLEAAAALFGCQWFEIIDVSARKLHKNSTVKPAMREVEIIAPVQAGAWREALEYPMEERKKVYIPADMPEANYFAFEVRGDSVDLIYPEGTVLICVSPYDLPSPIRDGDSVIVQRVRDDEYEGTVKILKIDEGRAYLMPRSSNPEHKPIIIPWPYFGGRDPKTGTVRVEIIGVVVQSLAITYRR